MRWLLVALVVASTIALVVASAIALAWAVSVVWVHDYDGGVPLVPLIVFLVPALAAAVGLARRRRWGAWLALVVGVAFMVLAVVTQYLYGWGAWNCDYAQNAYWVECRAWVRPVLMWAILVPVLTVAVSLVALVVLADPPVRTPEEAPHHDADAPRATRPGGTVCGRCGAAIFPNWKTQCWKCGAPYSEFPPVRRDAPAPPSDGPRPVRPT